MSQSCLRLFEPIYNWLLIVITSHYLLCIDFQSHNTPIRFQTLEAVYWIVFNTEHSTRFTAFMYQPDQSPPQNYFPFNHNFGNFKCYPYAIFSVIYFWSSSISMSCLLYMSIVPLITSVLLCTRGLG